MEPTRNVAWILGAASPLGAALARAASPHYAKIHLCDTPQKRAILSALLPRLETPRDRIHLREMNVELPFAGLPEGIISEETGRTDIYHAAHRMDRSLAASEIHGHNSLALERVFAIAYMVKNLGSITVITDAGLVGDFEGRFSEAWTDVGQAPFDDVDKSSLQVERACLEDKKLPILRCRTGLTLLPGALPELHPHWRSAADILLGSVKWLSKLPRFVSVPAAVAEGSLAPITPSEWAADVMVHLASEPKAVRRAHHLIVDPKPSIEAVLNLASAQLGGARIKGGLPVGLIAKLGKVPGFKEAARRNADHVAAWWTPHRYCLSKNDLDTSHLASLLPPALEIPTWVKVKPHLR